MPVPFVRYEFENMSSRKPRVKIRAHGTRSMPVANVIGPIEQSATAVVAAVDDVEDVYQIDVDVTWGIGNTHQAYLVKPSNGWFIHSVHVLVTDTDAYATKQEGQ